jgi:phosphoglycerate kinase
VKKILAAGGAPILMSHLGRPKGQVVQRYGLRTIADRLTAYVDAPIKFAKDCVGPETEMIVDSLKPGEVLLLENLRFHPEEEANDQEFAKRIAAYGDIFVNDAFGTAHRAHASTVGVPKYVEQSAAGLLMQRELQYLGDRLENPERPFVAILGGAKIHGKMEVIERLFEKVDALLIGGGMTYTFYRSLGFDVGNSLVDEERVEYAGELMRKAKSRDFQLVLPQDSVVANAMAYSSPSMPGGASSKARSFSWRGCGA